MKRNRTLILAVSLFFVTAGIFAFVVKSHIDENQIISYTVDVKKQDVKLYWKDDKNQNFRSILNLRLWLEKNKRKLVFAMNAGMYKQDHSPQGLFIEKQITVSPIDTSNGNGNFYLKPNGVFI